MQSVPASSGTLPHTLWPLVKETPLAGQVERPGNGVKVPRPMLTFGLLRGWKQFTVARCMTFVVKSLGNGLVSELWESWEEFSSSHALFVVKCHPRRRKGVLGCSVCGSEIAHILCPQGAADKISPEDPITES